MGNVHMEATQINYREGNKKMSVAEAIKNAGNTGLAHAADIAPEFSAETAYSAGDLVYYNGSLYVFTADHAAGAWSTEDTQAVTVGAELAALKSGLTNLTRSNGGDAVDITDRVGTANAYTIPTDGYVTLDTGASSSGGIDIRIMGANGYGMAYIILSSVTAQVVQSVYVRKGMTAFVSSNTTPSSTVKFRPFA